MNLLPVFARETGARRRLGLFALSAILALGTGFVWVSPELAGTLIQHAGYYYILGLFSAFVALGVMVAQSRREVWHPWLRPSWVMLALAAALVFVLRSDSYEHKILFDEYVLQATGFHMHATKEVGAVIRAYDINGTWLPIDTFLDKRPYFFSFLISLAHDLTGYRIANAFVLNSMLAGVLLALVYWFALQLSNRRAALFAVVLLATMPLLGQNATSAGMELHNVTMLVLVMCLALLYLRVPSDDRLALLCLGTVLLAQSRYESAVYALPVAVIVVLGWYRAGRVLLPWTAILTPLLFVPYAWHNRFLSASPLLWQLGEGQTSRFSLAYFPINIVGAVRFFFNTGSGLANSWYLSLLGFAGLGWMLWRGFRWIRQRTSLGSVTIVIFAFGTAVAGNLLMVQFYYWARLDDSVTSRFALPSTVMLAFLAAAGVARLQELWRPAMRAAFAGAAAYVLVTALPVIATRLYTAQNLAMKEIEWEREFVQSRPDEPRLFISNKSTIPWVLWRVPSIIIGVARQRGEQIRYHLAQGTFQEVIVGQALRPTTVDGKFGIDPDDVLPDNFKLEVLAEKRFGGRMARLSRIVAVGPETAKQMPAASAAPVSEGKGKPAS